MRKEGGGECEKKWVGSKMKKENKKAEEGGR